MTAGKYDFSIKQGSTFAKEIIYKDSTGTVVNLSGYGAKMQLRETYKTSPVIELTTANGRIEITPLEGKLTLKLSATETANLDFCKMLYDLDLFIGDDVYTILEGTIVLVKEVTRNVSD